MKRFLFTYKLNGREETAVLPGNTQKLATVTFRHHYGEKTFIVSVKELR